MILIIKEIKVKLNKYQCFDQGKNFNMSFKEFTEHYLLTIHFGDKKTISHLKNNYEIIIK
jgi:hypothetical protein